MGPDSGFLRNIKDLSLLDECSIYRSTDPGGSGTSFAFRQSTNSCSNDFACSGDSSARLCSSRGSFFKSYNSNFPVGEELNQLQVVLADDGAGTVLVAAGQMPVERASLQWFWLTLKESGD